MVVPYSEWDPKQLQNYLSEQGHQVDQEQAKEKNWLVESVKKSWQETESTAEEAYGSIKNWIFNSYVGLWCLLIIIMTSLIMIFLF